MEDQNAASALLMTKQSGSQDRCAPLPRHIKLFNLVLFGDGCYRGVPFLLALALSAWIAYYSSVTDYGITKDIGHLTSFAIALEACANAYFGYCYCRDKRFDKMLRQLERHGVDAKQNAWCLAVCGWVAFGFTVALIAWNVADSLSLDVAEAIGAVACWTYGWAQIFYLCALWAWCNWVFCRAANGIVARGITPDSVASQRASKDILQLLEGMREISRDWGVNHGVRFVSSLVTACGMLPWNKHPNAHPISPIQLANDWAGAMLLYVIVWCTAAIPGYVTTTFVDAVQRKLANVAHARPSPGLEVGDTPTQLMHRLGACRSATGMHFVGIPMTVQKAGTIGTVIGWAILYSHRL